MTNPPYQQLAKDFMDLWQKQISSVVGDKQFIQAMLDMFQSAQMPGYDRKNTATANASDAPDANAGMLAELTFRLAACERRLAALESGPAAGAGKGSKKPRK